MLDYLVKNVSVVDGTGQKAYPANVGFENGKIAVISNAEMEADQVIDGAGKVLSPGFIDMHSHTDLRIMDDPMPMEKIEQGVTTELFGQDGMGVAPISNEDDARTISTLVAGLLGNYAPGRYSWRSFGEYLEELEKKPLPNHVAVLASHGPIRLKTMGMDNRYADANELKQMQETLQQCYDEGAFGLSTGLIYPPCPYADENELVALNQVVAKNGGPFVVHQRDEGYLIRTAFAELTSACGKAGSHLHISHLQAYGQVNWPLMDDIIAAGERFMAAGNALSWDRYPYVAGCTVLSAVLPQWAFSEGTEALIKNLMVPEYRRLIRDEFKKGLDVWNNRSISVGWHNIFVTAVSLEKNRWMEGKHCAELAETVGKDPIDFVCDLLAEEKLAVTMISFYGCDEILEKVLCHPCATVGSDGIYGGKPHPRLRGCFAHFIHHFYGKKLMSIEECVHKITGKPAEILGIRDRGILKEGYWGDAVLFDPDTIRDTATYDEPSLPNEGISAVFLDGKLVLKDGIGFRAGGGKVLRKNA